MTTRRMATESEVRDWSYGAIAHADLFDDAGEAVVGGLECERIFGPAVDWRCRCGRYHGERYRAMVCERCGVEIIAAEARRHRIGHITLSVAVVHPHYGEPFTLLPVLPPGLRPSRPDDVHPIARAYLEVMTESDPVRIAKVVATLFVRLRDAALDDVGTSLAQWSSGAAPLPAGHPAGPSLFNRAMLSVPLVESS